jgi:hypothetical protein
MACIPKPVACNSFMHVGMPLIARKGASSTGSVVLIYTCMATTRGRLASATVTTCRRIFLLMRSDTYVSG